MAVDMFVKIDGIQGEAQDDKHKNEIDILSWSWGTTQSQTLSTGGGGGAGRASFQDLSFVHRLDRASPVLFRYAADGRHVPNVLLTVRKAGENALEYLKIMLKDCIVASVSTSCASEDPRPTETVGIGYNFIKIEYQMQKHDGSPDGGPVSQAWDLKGNKPA
jgi:type VI secretion system secreted protein Hcp